MDNTRCVANFIEVVSQALDVAPESITLETKRKDFSEWDSLGHIKIFLAIEGAFGVHFSMKEIEEIDSLNKIFKRVIENSNVMKT